jgi:NADH-quinone oxidoreductase subunit E
MAVEATTPMLSPAIREKILAHVPRYPSKRAVTLPALHIVHEYLRCVPHQAMIEIADLLDITAAEVHDTMSFYGFFPQAPIGDVRVWICRSISCMITGGDELLEHACRKLGIAPGQTTDDGKVTIEFAECLGICDYAPAALADDGRIFGPLTPETVDAMLEELKKGPIDPSHGLDPSKGAAVPSSPGV